MISCFLYGGLCNQLFQKATTIAHAMRHGYDYVIPTKTINPHSKEQKPYLFGGVNYSDDIDESLPVYKEPHFQYACLPATDNIRFDGYFQTEKYFHDFRDDIIEMFGMDVKKIVKGWCGVHVRRGDYLKWPEHHPPVSINYILRGISLMKENFNIRNFYFFSDDIPWCIESFSFVRDYVEFSTNKNEVDDLLALASCQYQIGSNSSFSWWGHYLCPNPDKIGYFPKKWFGPKLPHDTRDLYLRSMILI